MSTARERIARFGNAADGTPVERRLRAELDDERAKYDRLWRAFQLVNIEIDTLHARIAALEASNYVRDAENTLPRHLARRSISGGDSGVGMGGEDVGSLSTSGLLTFPAAQN